MRIGFSGTQLDWRISRVEIFSIQSRPGEIEKIIYGVGKILQVPCGTSAYKFLNNLRVEKTGRIV